MLSRAAVAAADVLKCFIFAFDKKNNSRLCLKYWKKENVHCLIFFLSRCTQQFASYFLKSNCVKVIDTVKIYVSA